MISLEIMESFGRRSKRNDISLVPEATQESVAPSVATCQGFQYPAKLQPQVDKEL